MRFHPIINKSRFNSVLNIDRLIQFVTKANIISIHVYSSNIVRKEVTSNVNMPMVRNVVCRDIFPMMKFGSLSKLFQEPSERVFDNQK